jgi:hypothetical protein
MAEGRGAQLLIKQLHRDDSCHHEQHQQGYGSCHQQQQRVGGSKQQLQGIGSCYQLREADSSHQQLQRVSISKQQLGLGSCFRQLLPGVCSFRQQLALIVLLVAVGYTNGCLPDHHAEQKGRINTSPSPPNASLPVVLWHGINDNAERLQNIYYDHFFQCEPLIYLHTVSLT